MSTEEERKKWREQSQRLRDAKKAKPKRKYVRRPRASDAVIYLRHARTAMIHQVASGESKLEDPVYMFALLALNVLEGESNG